MVHLLTPPTTLQATTPVLPFHYPLIYMEVASLLILKPMNTSTNAIQLKSLLHLAIQDEISLYPQDNTVQGTLH